MKLLWFLASACLLCAAKAQQFQNLDFELGSVPPNYDIYNNTPADRQQILPGWTTYYRRPGTLEDNPGPYPLLWRGVGDSFCIGSPCTDIGSSLAFHGKYGLRIDSGTGGGESGIRQVGQIPVDARTLTLKAGYGAGLVLKIDDHLLNPVVVGGDSSQVTLAVDVTPFAGQVHKLTIAARFYQIDHLQFSSAAAVALKPTLDVIQVANGRHRLFFTGMLQQAAAAEGPYYDLGAGVGGQDCCVEPNDPRVAGIFYRVRN